jgi:hypothetical protein
VDDAGHSASQVTDLIIIADPVIDDSVHLVD